MNKNKGFTLIELLAVILILGIIALIAIPTVNNILKESRTGAWKSTASQMIKSAENYYQLQSIKGAPYIVDFKTAASSEGTGKYIKLDVDRKSYITVTEAPSLAEVQDVMAEALALKGDIPYIDQIGAFQIDEEGQVALAFHNNSVYCMTSLSDSLTVTDYNNATSAGLVPKNGNVVCIPAS
jgi:prepilin-type N-terminal cleavage/methylation domain-containing protein